MSKSNKKHHKHICSSCGRPIYHNDLYFECDFCGNILCEACVDVDELIEASHEEGEIQDLSEYTCPDCCSTCKVHNKQLLEA
jgi:predicted RNA-binding Zn-ribbon protein involved in translation (DUF1610 family)